MSKKNFITCKTNTHMHYIKLCQNRSLISFNAKYPYILPDAQYILIRIKSMSCHLRSNLYGDRIPEGSLAAQALQLPFSDSAAMSSKLENQSKSD